MCDFFVIDETEDGYKGILQREGRGAACRIIERSKKSKYLKDKMWDAESNEFLPFGFTMHLNWDHNADTLRKKIDHHLSNVLENKRKTEANEGLCNTNELFRLTAILIQKHLTTAVIRRVKQLPTGDPDSKLNKARDKVRMMEAAADAEIAQQHNSDPKQPNQTHKPKPHQTGVPAHQTQRQTCPNPRSQRENTASVPTPNPSPVTKPHQNHTPSTNFETKPTTRPKPIHTPSAKLQAKDITTAKQRRTPSANFRTKPKTNHTP